MKVSRELLELRVMTKTAEIKLLGDRVYELKLALQVAGSGLVLLEQPQSITFSPEFVAIAAVLSAAATEEHISTLNAAIQRGTYHER